MRIFLTGASGFVGSAILRELVGAGHSVVGLARSDKAAQAVTDGGAEVHRGDLEDLPGLRAGAATCDAVIHTGFIHDFTNYEKYCELDREVIAALGSAGKRVVVTSALGVLPQGVATSEATAPSGKNPRRTSEEAAQLLGSKGTSIRLPPSTHGAGDYQFVRTLIDIARAKGVAAYRASNDNTWPAVHRLDAARLYRLAVEAPEVAPIYHAVAEEAVSFRAIAEVIGRKLGVPAVAMNADEAAAHFGSFAYFAAMDLRAASTTTRAALGWTPREVGLLADIEASYFSAAGA